MGHTFNYLLQKDLVFLCVAAVAVGSELIFQFLGDFRRTFEKHAARNHADRSAELTRMLRDLIGQYNSGHTTTKVQQIELELEDVTDKMKDNITKVMERGERLESLIDKTALLKSESVSFRAGAQRYNNELWWKDQRGRMILGLCVLAIIVIASWHQYGSLKFDAPLKLGRRAP